MCTFFVYIIIIHNSKTLYIPCHLFLQPSLLALAVLGCDLKLLGCDWLTAIVTLQSVSKIQGRELSVCYESVLSEYTSVALQYPLLVTPHSSPKSPREELKVPPPLEPSFNLVTQTDLQDLPAASVVENLATKDKLFVAS